MFSGFKEEKTYVHRTVKAFERLVGLEMKDAMPHGGFANFSLPHSAMSGPHLLVGEHAGFQDTLWGFGMRYAISSGVLAGRSLLNGGDYEASWRRELGPQLKTSIVNRCIFDLLGNPNYGKFLRHAAARPDPRDFLRRHYGPSLLKQLLAPWARRRFRTRRRDASCDHVDCHCVWCRHGRTHEGHVE
jgi:flavin-dependent dehydrogenase